jgi:hypothetical protein
MEEQNGTIQGAGDHYWWAGLCLSAIHAAEHAIAEAIEIALPAGAVLSLRTLEAEEEEHRRKTLGQLVRKLNQRARLDPGIERDLENFILRRNDFIHHFHGRFDVMTDEGSERAINFCKKLASEAFWLAQVFTAVSFAVSERLELVTSGAVRIEWESMPKDLEESMRHLANFYPAIIRERKT